MGSVQDEHAEDRTEGGVGMFKQLLEFVPDAIVGIDDQGHIVLANRQAEAMFGYERAELNGLLIETLVPARYLNHVAHRDRYMEQPVTRAMGAGTALAGLRKDGSEFPAEISLSSLTTDEGLIAVAAVRDITDRAESEREQLLQRELAQARRLESVGQLAGGVAHDFNNLLGVILNLCDFAAEETTPGTQLRSDVEEIKQCAQRAAALTRQLLIFSRRDISRRESLGVGELARGLENLLTRALGERVELQVTTEPDLWPVEADRGQIEQVLVNLAVNGRDAMPDGGRLCIETRNVVIDARAAGVHVGLEAGRYVRLTVHDTGTGMTPEVAERAFEPFFTTKAEGAGTGLGLATAYGIVTEAGGHISIDSELGSGTAIQIHLPAGEGAPTEAPATVAGGPAGRGETILVVEDEADVRRVTRRILERAGYEVLTAEGAEGALQELQRRPVDLLLTDVVMPGAVGPELVADAREGLPGLRVLYMSGYSHNILRPEEFEAQPRTAFIEKPFAAADLQTTIRDLLEEPSLEAPPEG